MNWGWIRRWIAVSIVLGALRYGVYQYTSTEPVVQQHQRAITEPLWTGTFDLGSPSPQRIDFDYHTPAPVALRLDLDTPERRGTSRFTVPKHNITITSDDSEPWPDINLYRPSTLENDEAWASALIFQAPAQLGPSSIVLTNTDAAPALDGEIVSATLWSFQGHNPTLPLFFRRFSAWVIGILVLPVAGVIAFWPSRR